MASSNQNNPKKQRELDEYFMATAFLAAKRSKDPCTRVGSCVVYENNLIIGIGYNGMPKNMDENPTFKWDNDFYDKRENKYIYVCHAALNAILNNTAGNVKNCTLYTGLFPCNECAKVIIQSGITEVVYMSDKYAKKDFTITSKKMFDEVKVNYRRFSPIRQEIKINFNEVDQSETEEHDIP